MFGLSLPFGDLAKPISRKFFFLKTSVGLVHEPVQDRTGLKTENRKGKDRWPDRKASVRSGPSRSGPIFGPVRSWTI